MRYLRIFLAALVLIPVLFSCNKTLNVNADWRDITVVYGLLSQNDDTTYLKITKAFLGEGDAMQFSRIADSSTYPDKLDVKIEAWSGNTLVKTFDFDTITIHNKAAGDSVFYFPTQMVYYCKTNGQLDENNTYRLKITHKKTGVVDSAVTGLVHNFRVEIPNDFNKQVDYIKGKNFETRFDQAYGGKRYQLLIRIHYLEIVSGVTTEKTVDWLVFNDYQVTNPFITSTEPISVYASGDGYYTVLKNNIKIDHSVSSRSARSVEYIFSVASDDLNTYMEVTEPSLSIIQERPSFSNIYNGVGLFSSRFVNKVDSIPIGQNTKDAMKTDTALVNRGF